MDTLTPTLDQVPPGETLIRLHTSRDEQGRCRFTAYWRDTNGDGQPFVRGQVFHTDPDRIVKQAKRMGHTVRYCDDAML